MNITLNRTGLRNLAAEMQQAETVKVEVPDEMARRIPVLAVFGSVDELVEATR